MIRSEAEYQQAYERLEAERLRLDSYIAEWKKQGYSAEEVARLAEPLRSFHEQLVEEVSSYERIKRGEIADFENLEGLGQVLIALRIARGMSQRELASMLGVTESLVSRDERNEYSGVTVDKAMRVLQALGVRIKTRVEVEPLTAAERASNASPGELVR
jgi:ribosome-binding protein aMBF1 (putative translation factor)